MKKLLTWFLLFALSLSLVGCTVKTEKELPSVTITDHAGHTVILNRPPERIISGYYIATSILISLGLEDRIVAVENQAELRNIYGLAAPSLLDVPGVGTVKDFDLEGALALKPDLVVLPLRLKEVADTLIDMGIPALCISPESQDLLVESVLMLSAAAWVSDTDLQDAMEKGVADLTETLADVERPTVYLAGNSDLLSTAGSLMYQHSLIALAGGENVAANIEDTYWATVSYEQLIAYNPDYIIVAPAATYTVEDVCSDPALQTLSCVQEGRVYQMPNGLEAWDSPLPGSYLGALWLATILHPDCYETADFTESTAQFYLDFYGIEVNTDTLVG